MAVSTHRTPQVTKCLQKLRRAGGRAELAAERAENIIAQLGTHDHYRPGQINRLTKNGEGRIERCQKFDLGSGYRLVYVKEGNCYSFLFAGTHDDCDRWLNNNRDLHLDVAVEPPPVPVTPAEDIPPSSSPITAASEMDYEALLMAQIDEKMLRRIFRGLCGEPIRREA